MKPLYLSKMTEKAAFYVEILANFNLNVCFLGALLALDIFVYA